jgi:hypothetical protein
MDGLKLAAVLLVLYTVALAAFVVASTLIPRVRAWYMLHLRAFAVLGLVAVVALFVEIGVAIIR